MRKGPVRVVLTMALLIGWAGAVWGSESSRPVDALGSLAFDRTAEYTLGQNLPRRSGSHSEYGVRVKAQGGVLDITYAGAAGDGDWHLAAYAWVPDPTAQTQGGPDNPDPDPPTVPGTHEGATKSSTFRIGDWEYTIRYEYTVRDGVPGWHIIEFTAVYTPKGSVPGTQHPN